MLSNCNRKLANKRSIKSLDEIFEFVHLFSLDFMCTLTMMTESTVYIKVSHVTMTS